ncbi:peptidoglycan-binding protein [Candidatus Saccharibacteria bacterium]|nr:peptidoglycan-binding protein [Candidatus Saccharibacteria bacterium]
MSILSLATVLQSETSALSCSNTYLRKGTTNYECVKVAQRNFNQWACPGQALAVDGSYGPITRAAITAFQADYNVNNSYFGASDILVDGITGPQTWAAFDRYAYWDFVLTPTMGHCISY